MSIKSLFSRVKPASLRKATLSVAVLALGAQCLFIGQPGKPPVNLFNPIVITHSNVLSTPNALGLVTYSSKGNLNREILPSDRDTVAILAQDRVIANGDGLYFPIISLVRAPSRSGPSNTIHRVTPISEQTQFPTTVERGELDPYFANAVNASEDLILGFDENSPSKLAVLRNFDTAALGSAANPNPDLPISQFIRFNCSSNPPVQNQDGSIQYQPCNNDPARPDPTSSVNSISTVDINCDNKLDIMVVADSTQDINDPNDRETGQRVFACLNYTAPGSSTLDFRCRDQGFRNVRAARPGLLIDSDPSPCEEGDPDCAGGGGGGGVGLPPLPKGARFATNSGNTCSGEYRGIGANEFSVVEFLGNFSHPTPAIDALVTEFPVLVKAVELELINNDALPDRVVLLQPWASWELGPSTDINAAARVEVCIRNPAGDGLECTPESQPRLVARGVYRDGAARYEYRDATMVGVADVTTACNSAPEILVASTGAGLGVEDMQGGGELTKDLSLMAVGGDRTSSYNLPLASLCVWPGSLQRTNPAVCSVAPGGVVPTIIYAGLGNFTSSAGRDPALTYPVDSALLVQKEGLDATGQYQFSYEVQFVSSSSANSPRLVRDACVSEYQPIGDISY